MNHSDHGTLGKWALNVLRRGKKVPKASVDERILRLEPLEPRFAPAIFTVTSTVDGAAGSLRDAISQANASSDSDNTIMIPAGTFGISLAGSGEENNATGDFDVRNNNLTLVGEGSGSTVITANQLDRVFDVFNGVNVTFQGLTIRDGFVAGDGGGVRSNTAGSLLTFTDVVVTSNVSSGSGGGVFNTAGDVVLDSSSFTGNVASADGGAIAGVSDTLSLTDSALSGNSAFGNGGGLANLSTSGSVTIINSMVTDNLSALLGGGAYSTGDFLSISGSTISNNLSQQDGGGFYSDGASSGITIDGSTIADNRATGDGGGFFAGNSGPVSITGQSEISGNNAGVGGGFRLDGLLSGTLGIANSTISDNTAQSDGGGFYADNLVGDVDISDSTISLNHTDDQGGGFYLVNSGGDLSLTNATINDNSSTREGAGFFAQSFGDGAGEDLTIGDSTIAGNSAGDEAGGFLAQNIGNDVSIRDTTLRDNSAGDWGGAFALYNAADVVLTRVTVHKNFADSDGGAFDVSDHNSFTINDSTLTNNVAGDEGGVLWAGSSSIGDLSINNSTIKNNSAADDGGAFHITSAGNVSINNSTISSNTSGDLGGAIYLDFSEDLIITKSTISDNSAADRGGAVYFRGDTNDDLIASDSTIDSNISDADGGGIYFTAYDLTMNRTTVSNNVSGGDGGGVYHSGTGGTVVANSTFSTNMAAGEGGGVYHVGGTMTVTNITVAFNDAANGGGVSAAVGVTYNTRNSLYANNSATGVGPDFSEAGSATLNADNNNAVTDTSGSTGFTGSDLTDDPDIGLIRPLQNNGGPTETHRLLEGNPAIDGGNNAFITNPPFNGPSFTDQRGETFDRIFGSNVDIGAFELSPPPFIVVGAGSDGGPHVRVLDANSGDEIIGFFAYNPNFRGGVRVATGDVNNDGVPDIITAPGSGGGPHVRVFDGATMQQMSGPLGSFYAFTSTFRGGVFVAAADVNNDGFADVITGAGPGGGPHVVVRSGADGSILHSFFAYSRSFRGGVRVAGADVNGDGFADVITGAGPGGGPHVRVFDGTTGSPLSGPIGSFFAFNSNFRGGVFVAGGDVDGDGNDDVVVGAGGTGDPRVVVRSGADGSILHNFVAFDPEFRGGVRVSTADVSRDGFADLVVSSGPGNGAQVAAFDGTDLSELNDLSAFPGLNVGVFVAANSSLDASAPPLRAARVQHSANVEMLTAAQLEVATAGAIQRFAAAGLGPDALDRLEQVEFRITNLAGDLLGSAFSNLVTIDSDAAGMGWFVDHTPLEDSEFENGGPEGYDLISALGHELGHILGAEHSGGADSLVSEILQAATRRRNWAELVDELFELWLEE